MREIVAAEVIAAVAAAVRDMNFQIRPDMLAALERALAKESSPLGRRALETVLENIRTASSKILPLCQDTGLTVMFVEQGDEVRLVGASLVDALQEAVRQATQAGRLRHSVTLHPLTRGNSKDNTPAIIHVQPVAGDRLRLRILAKGAGCENASAMAMLPPSAARHGVGDFVVNVVRENGAAACPPLIVGVGVGGNFERAPFLAKHALLREIGQPSPDPILAHLEEVILQRINDLGLGPQGWGGSTTALAVAIEAEPCHIASLPVAVNIECHSHRMQEVIL